MELLEGKEVAENLQKNFIERIEKIKKEKNIIPKLAVLGISGDKASEIYIKKIEKNCIKYGIEFILKMASTQEEFKENFEQIKKDRTVTSIMFQEPLPKNIANLINEIPAKQDVEGIGIQNMGKLMLDKKDALIPCTSRAVIETIDFYNIDVAGKEVVIVGRSNIVGKPLIPQLLKKNATVTICHSKTKNLAKILKQADIVIMAIGKAKFLKADMIKDNSILIDVGINYEEGKIVGDIDFEDVKQKVKAITPVPGGIGKVTSAVLISNIISSCECN